MYKKGQRLYCYATYDSTKLQVGSEYKIQYVGKYGITINDLSFGNDSVDKYFKVVIKSVPPSWERKEIKIVLRHLGLYIREDRSESESSLLLRTNVFRDEETRRDATCGIIFNTGDNNDTTGEYGEDWVSSFIRPFTGELTEEQIEVIKNFADYVPSVYKNDVLALIDNRQPNEKRDPDQSCVLWAEPQRVNGVYNEGREGLIDIYKALTRTAFDRLGEGIISSYSNKGEQEVPRGEVVMISKPHFDKTLEKFTKRYGEEQTRDILESLLWEGALKNG